MFKKFDLIIFNIDNQKIVSYVYKVYSHYLPSEFFIKLKTLNKKDLYNIMYCKQFNDIFWHSDFSQNNFGCLAVLLQYKQTMDLLINSGILEHKKGK